MEVGKPNRVFVEQCHKLASLQGDENDHDGGQALGVQRDLQVHLEQKELKWRQWPKINWLSHGDKNSKFFHSCANQRQKVNNISEIKDEGGRLWESQEEVGGFLPIIFKACSQLVER
jgi:hypothetical protein